MKYYLKLIVILLSVPFFATAQVDTMGKKPADSLSAKQIDSLSNAKPDTVIEIKKTADTTVITTPTNCYKEWYDFFRTRGSKPVTDGMQEVVIAFKSAESCICYMGRIEVAGGKIKAPLYIQNESGEYKPVASLGKKLDPNFVADIGDQLWVITDGMSALFRTSDQENGRLFFYKFLNKSANSNKTAPSPQDLIKD